jgi:hypothetical protein
MSIYYRDKGKGHLRETESYYTFLSIAATTKFHDIMETA